MEDQLQFVDDFEDAIRAESDEAYMQLYAEYEKSQNDCVEAQQAHLNHLVEHTKYVMEVHTEINRLNEKLRHVTGTAMFYLFTTLVACGYIFFNM